MTSELNSIFSPLTITQTALMTSCEMTPPLYLLFLLMVSGESSADKYIYFQNDIYKYDAYFEMCFMPLLSVSGFVLSSFFLQLSLFCLA